MKKVFTTLLLLCFSFPLLAGVTNVDGKWYYDKYEPLHSVQEHYDLGMQALGEKAFDDAYQHFTVITHHYHHSPFYADSLFFSGVCHFHQMNFDRANRQFSSYLDLPGYLKHFEEVFEYKFQMAESLRGGQRKPLFGMKALPKWVSGRGQAIALYDEVAAALPSHPLAARSLFGKAELLLAKKEFKESVEAFQLVTRRYSKDALAPESFIKMGEIYLTMSREEAQNPDLLGKAKLNLQKFKEVFPGETRVVLLEESMHQMEEVFASSLYETGRFYERKKKPHASALYYSDAARRYPSTEAAEKSRERLTALDIPETAIAIR